MAITPSSELNDRARDVFRVVVESYLGTGVPVGSRTISKLSGLNLSSASIRNVMQDLEELGLIAAPHTSAGRMPTESGRSEWRRVGNKWDSECMFRWSLVAKTKKK